MIWRQRKIHLKGHTDRAGDKCSAEVLCCLPRSIGDLDHLRLHNYDQHDERSFRNAVTYSIAERNRTNSESDLQRIRRVISDRMSKWRR